MINKILGFCQNVNFVLNLYELIKDLSLLVLITMLVLVVNKIVCTIIKGKIIDAHMRETRASIARVVIEIEEYKEVTLLEVKDIGSKITQSLGERATKNLETLPNIKATEQVIEKTIPNMKEEVQSIQKDSEHFPKGKKTRAMSTEERWAEFDKKRSMINTA